MNTSKREWIKIPANKNISPYSLFECPICGYLMAWHERNCASHKRTHNHVLDIQDKYGIWLDYVCRESLKSASYRMVSETSSLQEKKLARLLAMYSRFMRSLDSYPDIDAHPCFEDYVSMILHQETFNEESSQIYCKNETTASLIEDFGTMKGIPYGSYFLDDYSGLSEALLKNYHNSIEHPRNAIPDEYKEVAIRRWVQGWISANHL